MKIRIGTNSISISDETIKSFKNKDLFASYMIRTHPHLSEDKDILKDRFGAVYELLVPTEDK